MGCIVGKGDEKLNDMNGSSLMTCSHQYARDQYAVARFLRHRAVLIDSGMQSLEYPLDDPVLDERSAVVRT
jgi:hypothetical protein